MTLLLFLFASTTDAAPSPWIDWRAASRESVAAEQAQMRSAGERPRTATPEQAQAGRELGERVGRVVAEGDCAEGERLARAAGDVPLARAVRDHCYKP